jgi:hypothetical protein
MSEENKVVENLFKFTEESVEKMKSDLKKDGFFHLKKLISDEEVEKYKSMWYEFYNSKQMSSTWGSWLIKPQ